MKISICIPTIKKEINKQLEDIKKYISSDAEIFASSQDVPVAVNRNYCLDKAKGDIIIMVDDDITGFFPNWDKILIKPLEDNSVSIVSARLINSDGTPAPMMYDGQPQYKIVPTACIAFRKTEMRFDERFIRNFEDVDFCKQMAIAYPQKRIFVNEDCKLIHLNEKKRQNEPNNDRKHFVSKWGWVHHPRETLATIVYYTGNTEKESFESKVRENILRTKGNQPIVSVSQKPIEFGENICVGDVGKSYLNAFRQCLIGCEAAKTPFVIMTESDCLYPKKGYFDFVPTDLNTIYDYDNVWLMWDRENRTHFYKHGTTCGSMILGREFYIKMLKEGLEGKPTWGNIKAGPDFFNPDLKWEKFHGDPIINIKTRNGVSFGTTLTKGVRPKKSFPRWGTVEDIKRNYL